MSLNISLLLYSQWWVQTGVLYCSHSWKQSRSRTHVHINIRSLAKMGSREREVLCSMMPNIRTNVPTYCEQCTGPSPMGLSKENPHERGYVYMLGGLASLFSLTSGVSDTAWSCRVTVKKQRAVTVATVLGTLVTIKRVTVSAEEIASAFRNIAARMPSILWLWWNTLTSNSREKGLIQVIVHHDRSHTVCMVRWEL